MALNLAYTKQDPARLSFFDLPYEVRQFIYRDYVTHDDGISIHLVSSGAFVQQPCCDCCAQDGSGTCDGQLPCNVCTRGGRTGRYCAYPPVPRSRAYRRGTRGEWPWPREAPFRATNHQISTDTQRQVFAPIKRKSPFSDHPYLRYINGYDKLAKHADDMSTRRYFTENTKSALPTLRQVCRATYNELIQYDIFDLNTFNIVTCRLHQLFDADGTYHFDLGPVLRLKPQLRSIEHLTLTGDITWQFNAQTKQRGNPVARFVWPGLILHDIFLGGFPRIDTVRICARDPYDHAEIDSWLPTLVASKEFEGDIRTCRSKGYLHSSSGQPLEAIDAIGFTEEQGDNLTPIEWTSDPNRRLDPARNLNGMFFAQLRRVPAGITRIMNNAAVDATQGIEGDDVEIVDIVTIRAPFNALAAQLRFWDNRAIGMASYFNIEIGATSTGGYFVMASQDLIAT